MYKQSTWFLNRYWSETLAFVLSLNLVSENKWTLPCELWIVYVNTVLTTIVKPIAKFANAVCHKIVFWKWLLLFFSLEHYHTLGRLKLHKVVRNELYTVSVSNGWFITVQDIWLNRLRAPCDMCKYNP